MKQHDFWIRVAYEQQTDRLREAQTERCIRALARRRPSAPRRAATALGRLLIRLGRRLAHERPAEYTT